MSSTVRAAAAVAVLVALVAVGAAGLLDRGGGGGSPSSRLTDINGTPDPESGLPVVGESALPPEARQTMTLIYSGGPFPYPEDGEVFGNYEGLLPDEPRGYYREYTVETPGSPDRGARRIIAGSHDELFWTADHYASFYRIDPSS